MTPNKNSITLVFITNEVGFKFHDTIPDRFFSREELPDILSSAKTEKGDALSLILKKSPIIIQSDVDEWLTQLKKMKIIKYSIVDANKEELELLARVQNELRLPAPLDLNLPKDTEETEKITPDINTYTCIVLNEKEIYCYQNIYLKEGKYYSLNGGNSFRNFLKKAKTVKGKDLSIIIKPSPNASYKATVDILDEMTIGDIKKYSMTKLSKNENEFLNITTASK